MFFFQSRNTLICIAKQLIAGFLSLLMMSSVANSSGWKNPQQESDDNALFLRRSIEISRNNVRRGAYWVTGRVETKGTTSQGDVSRTRRIDQFCAFDFDKGLLRIDDLLAIDDPDTGTIEYLKGQFVRTPEKTIHLPAVQDTIGIQSISRENPPWAEMQDFRVVGIGFCGDVSSRSPYEWVWKHYSSRGLKTEAAGELTKITWDPLPNKTFVVEMYIDESRDYWPVRLFVRESADTPPHIECELELTMKSGIHLPQKFRGSETNPGYTKEVSLEFEWLSANQELDPSFFDYRSFETRGETKVADFRLDEPFVVEILGKQGPVPARPNSRKSWAIGLLTVLAIGAVVAAVYRIRKIHQKSRSSQNGNAL